MLRAVHAVNQGFLTGMKRLTDDVMPAVVSSIAKIGEGEMVQKVKKAAMELIDEAIR